MRLMVVFVVLMGITISAYSQTQYTLFVGEFENKSGVDNPLLDYLTDTIDFLFSRGNIAEIDTVSPGLRSAYLARVKKEQPKADITQQALRSAEYANANLLLLGSYTKAGTQWNMMAQLYVKQDKNWTKEDIQLTGTDVYRLLDNLVTEVPKRLKAPQQYVPPPPKTNEAYELYRQGHKAFYSFDLMGAINNFQQAIQLEPHLAVAYAELGLSYAMFSMLDKANIAFDEAIKQLKYASKQERLVVMGLNSFYRYFWVLGKGGGGLSGADMPRMREDMVWNEPWLNWYIVETTEDKDIRIKASKTWLVSAKAYAKAGFYGKMDFIDDSTKKIPIAFDYTLDPKFLDTAIEFITQATDEDPNDEYDNVWKYWELSNIYDKMGRPADVQNTREQWLQSIKNEPINRFQSNELNDIAIKCLQMGALKEALEFASKAVERESNSELHSLYLITLADANFTSENYEEAFNSYLEAFQSYANGSAGTVILSKILPKLTEIVSKKPDLIDNAKREKLNNIITVINNSDPLIFRGYSAAASLNSPTTGGGLQEVLSFYRAMGNIKPIIKIIKSLLNEEADQAQQIVYIAALIALNGNISESERNWLSSPKFYQSIPQIKVNMANDMVARVFVTLGPFQTTSLNYHFAGWIYEMIGEREKAIEIYQQVSNSKDPEGRIIATCALISLYRDSNGTNLSKQHIYFEAEDATKLTPPFEIAKLPETSGGKYIWVPDTVNGSNDNKGEAEYIFDINQPGTYRLVGRMLGYYSYAQNMNITIGDNKATLNVGINSAWNWRISDNSFILPAGKHKLILHNKDDGVKIDCMVLYREK